MIFAQRRIDDVIRVVSALDPFRDEWRQHAVLLVTGREERADMAVATEDPARERDRVVDLPHRGIVRADGVTNGSERSTEALRVAHDATGHRAAHANAR